MKFTVIDDTPLKTVVSCINLYHAIKRCFKSEPEKYRLKGISLYLGEREQKNLDDEMTYYE